MIGRAARNAARSSAPEGQHMKKVKERKKREKEKKPVRVKEDGRLEKAKINTIPSCTPGELPKR